MPEQATRTAQRATWLGVLVLLGALSVGRLLFTTFSYGVPAWFDEELNPLIGLITTMLAITLFKANFTRWGNWFVGKRGEMAISDALGSLSDDYIVLNDLMLPDGKGNVDHLVMGPNGLFAIETKNYSTFVKCSGDDWFVNGKKIRSLSKQAKRNAISGEGGGWFLPGKQASNPALLQDFIAVGGGVPDLDRAEV